MDIAVNKIIDESHQLRLFLLPRISTKNYESTEIGRKNNIEQFSYSFGIGAAYLWILISDEEINMFGGTGLIASFGNINSKTTEKLDLQYISKSEQTNTNAGIRWTLGVEWKVSKKIGICSEYLLTGLYNWNKTESKYSRDGVYAPPYKTRSTGISLDTAVLSGVSIYL